MHLFYVISGANEGCMEFERGRNITGFTIPEDELKVLHDVYSSTVEGGAKKASYIVQFLWRDITSGYDLVGPYFPIEASITSNTLQEFVMLCLKAFTAYGFKVSIILCDGASSNLTVLKILTGYERKELPVNEAAGNLHEKFFLDVSFPNPEDPHGRPIFVMICPSHQVVIEGFLDNNFQFETSCSFIVAK